MALNNNNFFVKFARTYIGNLRDIKSDAVDLWEAIIGLLGFLLVVIGRLLLIAKHITLIFCPVLQAWVAITVIYLTENELIELEASWAAKEGYYSKKSIKKLKDKLFKEVNG